MFESLVMSHTASLRKKYGLSLEGRRIKNKSVEVFFYEGDIRDPGLAVTVGFSDASLLQEIADIPDFFLSNFYLSNYLQFCGFDWKAMYPTLHKDDDCDSLWPPGYRSWTLSDQLQAACGFLTFGCDSIWSLDKKKINDFASWVYADHMAKERRRKEAAERFKDAN